MNRVLGRLFSTLSLLVLLPVVRPTALSPYYWWHEIRQWEPLILRYADRINIDPNFLAALIVCESGGDADEISPAGAVGLMQVMPFHLGYNAPAATEALRDPDRNMAWGTWVLQNAIEMADGDIFHALALYNGGSEFAASRESRGYAERVLRMYLQAVITREGYDPETINNWRAIFQIQGRAVDIANTPAPGWVVTSHHWQSMPDRAVVNTVLYEGRDEYFVSWRVVVWLLPDSRAGG